MLATQETLTVNEVKHLAETVAWAHSKGEDR